MACRQAPAGEDRINLDWIQSAARTDGFPVRLSELSPKGAISGTSKGTINENEVGNCFSTSCYLLAEAVGFEPTEPCGSTVFKTAAFNHSATPPHAVYKDTTERGETCAFSGGAPL